MRIEIFTRPNCGQCTATKKWLTRDGVPFVEAALDDEHLAYARSNGITSAPLVIVWDDDTIVSSWGGFRPGNIKAAAEKYRAHAITTKYAR